MRKIYPSITLICWLWSSLSPAAIFSDRIFETQAGLSFNHADPQRDPFQAQAGSSQTPEHLQLQGVLAHPTKPGLALISGQIVWAGEKFGPYELVSVRPGEVTLKSPEKDEIIKTLPGYVKNPKTSKDYSMSFSQAPLGLAIQMLGRLAGKNTVSNGDLKEVITMNLEEVNPTEAMNSLLRVHGYAMLNENNIYRIGKPDQFESGFDMQTISIPMNYASATELSNNVKGILSAQGTAIADPRTNTLAIRDRPHVLSNIRTLLSSLDLADKKVKIDAKIIAASKDFAQSIGIQWGVSKSLGFGSIGGSNQVGTGENGTPLNVGAGADNPNGGVNLLIGSLSGDNIDATLTAAESNGDVNIISKPSITALNNQAAKIRSGTKIYVKANSDISVGGSGGGASGSESKLESIETGVMLTVTPQITHNNKIKLMIMVEESTADFSRTVDGIPAILDNTASTNVLLNDKETTVIGGLFRTQNSKESLGLPMLSRIPVFGLLFSKKNKAKQDSELMIMITPEIIES